MSNIITAKLVEGEGYRTESLWQWDYGQVLQFIEEDLPDTYEVHFSNTKHGDAVKMIGDASGVSIPDMMLVTGQTVFVWLYLHTGDSDGETEYQITIPVKNRARPVEDQPTPVQQSLIEQALAALNIAVAQCNADVSHFPIVIEDYWCVWNEAEQQWVSTGTKAQGEKGDNAYVYIKYSHNEPTADSDMTDVPDRFMGVATGNSATAPEHYTDYSWYQIKGDQSVTFGDDDNGNVYVDYIEISDATGVSF